MPFARQIGPFGDRRREIWREPSSSSRRSNPREPNGLGVYVQGMSPHPVLSSQRPLGAEPRLFRLPARYPHGTLVAPACQCE